MKRLVTAVPVVLLMSDAVVGCTTVYHGSPVYAYPQWPHHALVETASLIIYRQ